MKNVFDWISQFAQNYVVFLMICLLFAIAMLSGCGTRTYTKVNDWEITEYAELASEEYFGFKPAHGNIMMGDIEIVAGACGGVACNNMGTIIIHEDTDEYICQQIMHELGHSASYELYKDWDYNHTLLDDFYNGGFISEKCSVF